MKGTPAVYLGRIVDKNHFRTFVYGPNGEQKLVESWEAYEAAMQSGVWFAEKIPAENENSAMPIEKPKLEAKAKPKPKAKSKLDDMVFEVKDGE